MFFSEGEHTFESHERLELAENIFKLSIQVNHIAQGKGLPESSVLFWSFGKHTFEEEADGLDGVNQAVASSMMVWLAAELLVIEMKEFLQKHQKEMPDEFLVAKHLRNAFAHGPLGRFGDSGIEKREKN